MSKPKTKITDEDLESMLKMFTPNDILNKFISNGSEKLTYKQLFILKLSQIKSMISSVFSH